MGLYIRGLILGGGGLYMEIVSSEKIDGLILGGGGGGGLILGGLIFGGLRYRGECFYSKFNYFLQKYTRNEKLLNTRPTFGTNYNNNTYDRSYFIPPEGGDRKYVEKMVPGYTGKRLIFIHDIHHVIFLISLVAR